MRVIVVLLAFGTPLLALAKAPACQSEFDKALQAHLSRLSAAVDHRDGARTLRFAGEVRSLWRLIQQHHSSGCAASGQPDDAISLSVEDGWHVYQAICQPTLARALSQRLRRLRADLRAGRTDAVRQGVMSLAAKVARDPQYAECKGLTARMDALMVEDLPRLLREVIRSESPGRDPQTAEVR